MNAVMDRVVMMLDDLEMADVELLVPAPPERWSRKPEEAFELADGQVGFDLTDALP